MIGWLFGFRAQTGSVAYWSYATFVRRLGEAAAPGGGEGGPCPDFASNALAFSLQLRKITENISQGNRMELGRSATNAIRFVDLATAGDDLEWPAVPCHPWLSRQATESTLGQLKYLPSCRNRGFPTSANFESKLGQGCDVVGKQPNAQILVYLPVTYVPRGTSSEAKTLGF